MAIKTFRWRPGTCVGTPCDIRELYDTDTGSWSVAEVSSRCSAHAGIANDAQLYATLHTDPASECKRVGYTRQWLMDNLSGLTETYLNQEGQTQIRIKTGVTLNLDLQGTGADRVLHVSVVGMNVSQNQKNAAQAWCDSNFGVGKIVID